MNQYWYLCGETGHIKYAGKFIDFDACDEYLNSISSYVVWIFSNKPEVENGME